jgi:uncharacterized membrane protein YphA (DoxX/SURF4 family)
MNASMNRFSWRESHENYGLDLIRIFLGIALFIRGYLFMTDQTLLQDFIAARGFLVGGLVIHYVILAHLYGGFIMALGLMTRIAALVQIPVLLGAVYLHLTEGLLAQGQSLELSVLVLFLLCLIFVFGPGRLSLDYYFFKWKPAVTPGIDQAQSDHERAARRLMIEETRGRAEREHSAVTFTQTDVAVLVEPRTETTTGTPVRETAPEPEAAGERVKQTIRYAGIFIFAFVLFASLILMDIAPIFTEGIAAKELAVFVGVVLFILGLFFFVYRSAFMSTDERRP